MWRLVSNKRVPTNRRNRFVGRIPRQYRVGHDRWSRHLKECNLYKAKQPQSQSSITSFLSTNESQIGQNDLLSKVLQCFISANIPFNVADNPYFQELIQTAQSKNNVQMVNHNNIR